ncbi:hypothetical protein BZG01_13995 [Labilibaculum manganireducens]|uniref:Uncharacterized protein n=1 Tax=Labilibaculum manganireducens TaxID=1940525 RepID=A0A2N3I2W0_9BACT|nr:hypothetical protein [Labilibaculum manganireducens]PKQ64641.1 hypothetical protein BZG01_13995 [Labilibaculum manganireducens]
MEDSLQYSVLKRDKFLETAANTQFDFVILSVGIKEVLFAFFAAVNGYKCAILTENDFQESLHPIVDTSESTHPLVLAFRNRFPHLILPDEYLKVKRNTSKWEKIFTGSIRDKDISKYEPTLTAEADDAVYIDKEFKISTNRLLLSILKSAVQQGAVILNHVTIEIKSDSEIVCYDKTNAKSYAISYQSLLSFSAIKKTKTKTEIRFCLHKKGLFLKRSLKFTLDGVLIRMVRYQDYFMIVCDSQPDNRQFVRMILQEINRIVKWENEFNEDDIISSELAATTSNDSLKNHLMDFAKVVENKLSISYSQLLQQIPSLPVTDTQFEGKTEIQQLIEFGDSRFDEAKQTGVHPVPFKNMFYRFGSEIEELTEKAYELRAQFGPGNDLWVYVQLWYLYQNEMICTKEDYISRIRKSKPVLDSDLGASEDVINEYFNLLNEKHVK